MKLNKQRASLTLVRIAISRLEDVVSTPSLPSDSMLKHVCEVFEA